MIVRVNDELGLSKRSLAEKLGMSVSSLYYKPKKPQSDWNLKNRIEQVLHQHPGYGHKRLAVAMAVNKKRIRRVMKLFGIKPYRRRGRKWRKAKDLGIVHQNLIQQLPFPDRSNIIWVSDFTYIPFHSRTVYLATIKDVFDRRIVGWALLTAHTNQLVISALIDAVEKHGRPEFLHSDQGSEYKSRVYCRFAQSFGIKLSMSHKGSPWENGYQESFYSHFKIDLGDSNRFKTLGELAVAIFLQIHYYNNLRIHSTLKMPPQQFVERRPLPTKQLSVKL